MHWCPICHQPCFCDCDDTDYGEYECLEHNEMNCGNETDYEDDMLFDQDYEEER